MKNYSKFTYFLALWIVFLFVFAMFATYFSEYLQSSGFFGDYLYTAANPSGHIDMCDSIHGWGIRHYWYVVMCILLFSLSIARISMWTDHFWIKNKYGQ